MNKQMEKGKIYIILHFSMRKINNKNKATKEIQKIKGKELEKKNLEDGSLSNLSPSERMNGPMG